ncbi:hypothetical protein OQA88_12958 [Cercophora sp. LCS_1]
MTPPPTKRKPVTASASVQKTSPTELGAEKIHPSRQSLLDAPEEESPAHGSEHGERGDRSQRRRPKKPAYYAKQLALAEEKRAEQEARAAERQRREDERNKRIAERETYRKKMAKAKEPGRDGRVKLGRESGVLLDRVRRLMEG